MTKKATHVSADTKVDDDGLSAEERDKKEEMDRLYRWMKNAKRRV